MEAIKATDYIIKVRITSGNIKWRSFALRFRASNHKSTWQPMLPSSKGPSFTFVLCIMQESWWSSPFLFTFYPLASTLCWKDPDIYISNWMYVSMNYYCWHYPWGKRLGGSIISPIFLCVRLKLHTHKYCVSVSNCERLNDSWVCGLAEKLLHWLFPMLW